MLVGPIFHVEMVAAARRGQYYLLRVLYAAVILFVLWMTFANARVWSESHDGRVSIGEVARTAGVFFWSFSWVQLVGLLVVAPALAVGTIASERERRTIEYLFATDLSNTEIVLGKTAARLLSVGAFAAVSLPILFLFRLLGGIPANLVAASFLIAGSTSLFITALSVAISVWSKRSRDASMRIYLVLAALLILPPMLGSIFGWQFRGSPLWQQTGGRLLAFLNGLNPLLVLGQTMSGTLFNGAALDFAPTWHMVAWHAAISAALVALATVAVRRVHLRELSRGADATGSRWKLPAWPRWRPEVGGDPMLWKEAFAATAKSKLGFVGAVAIGAIGLTAFGWVAAMFWWAVVSPAGGQFGPRRQYFHFVSAFTMIVGAGLLLLAAARASALITLEKERDCWTSLVSTPLTGGEIVRGKTLGNLYALRWGFALLLLTWLTGIAFDARYALVVLVEAAVFALCAWFVTSVGILFSLKSSTSLRAMGMTLLVTVFAGGGYLLCCCPLFAVGGGNDWMAVGLAPCLPFLMFFPTMAFANGFQSELPAEMSVAFMFGTIGYLIACMSLAIYMAAEFDALAGRTVGRPYQGKAST